jgi:MYXO-CTERM domain-containing protein
MHVPARLALVLAASAALHAATAAPAEACSPQPPGLSSSIPKDGDTYPANAALFFSGQGISLDNVQVKVDGQSASLVPVPDPLLSKLAGYVVTVAPKPAAGQTVQISGDFCLPGAMCPPVSIKYTAGPDDTTAPPSPSAFSFNVHDYPDFTSSGGDCQSDSDLAYWLHIEGTAAQAGEAKVALLVEAFRDTGLSNLAFSRTLFASAPDTVLALRQLAGDLQGAPPPEAYSFRVTLFDAAGNKASSPATALRPCHFKTEGGDKPFAPPAEPMWTAADIYPGGSCAGGGAGGAGGGSAGSGGAGGNAGSGGNGGNDDVAVAGCSCSLPGPAGRQGPAVGLALAALAGLCARRRRRP